MGFFILEKVYIKDIIMCYVVVREYWYNGKHKVRLTYRRREKRVEAQEGQRAGVEEIA
jgi:hypothetical protein